MVQSDLDSSASDPVAGGNPPHLASPGKKPVSMRYGRLLAFAIAGAVIAGVGSVLTGEVVLNRYQSALTPPPKISPTTEDIRRLRDARVFSAALTFTAMGGFLGLALGFAGGLARRSVQAGFHAASLGLLVGAAAAGSLAFLLVSLFFNKYDPQSSDLVLPLITHAAIWSAVGAIGGTAFGLGLGGRGRWMATLVGGLLGAAAASVIYEIVGAIAFASSKTDLPLSAALTTRVLAQFSVALLAAVGAVLASNHSARKELASPGSPELRTG
jgi:hypothetical protein